METIRTTFFVYRRCFPFYRVSIPKSFEANGAEPREFRQIHNVAIFNKIVTRICCIHAVLVSMNFVGARFFLAILMISTHLQVWPVSTLVFIQLQIFAPMLKAYKIWREFFCNFFVSEKCV